MRDPVESRDQAPVSILFVEDDKSCLEFGVFVLRAAGYSVDAARNGQEALDLLSVDRHWLVITDLRMPGMSGRILVRTIRASVPEMQLIVVTASPLDNLVGSAVFSGVYGFLKKPYSRAQLLKMVAAADELRVAQDSLVSD